MVHYLCKVDREATAAKNGVDDPSKLDLYAMGAEELVFFEKGRGKQGSVVRIRFLKKIFQFFNNIRIRWRQTLNNIRMSNNIRSYLLFNILFFDFFGNRPLFTHFLKTGSKIERPDLEGFLSGLQNNAT